MVEPASASQDDLVVRASERPPETEPTCPRTGPTNSWFEQHGLYTPNCGACKNLELGLGRSGKSHSARCCRAYVEWLKEEHAKLGVGQPVVEGAQVEERPRCPVVDSPVPSPSSPGDAGEGEDVVPVPGSIFNDEEVVTSEPAFDDAMGDVGPSSASGARASRKRGLKLKPREFLVTPLLGLAVTLEGLNDQLKTKTCHLSWRMSLRGLKV